MFYRKSLKFDFQQGPVEYLSHFRVFVREFIEGFVSPCEDFSWRVESESYGHNSIVRIPWVEPELVYFAFPQTVRPLKSEIKDIILFNEHQVIRLCGRGGVVVWYIGLVESVHREATL